METAKEYADLLNEVFGLIYHRFARSEPRFLFSRCLRLLVIGTKLKSYRQFARQLGNNNAHSLERLLRKDQVDEGGLREDLRTIVVKYLGDPQAYLAAGFHTFEKWGDGFVGAVPCSSPAHRLSAEGHHQRGLFLAYCSPRGTAFIDHALFLPNDYVQDYRRRRIAKVPNNIGFETPGELARHMSGGAIAAEVPFESYYFGVPREFGETIEVGQTDEFANAMQEALDVGLAPPARTWTGWHRHMTLILLAHAIQVVARARANNSD